MTASFAPPESLEAPPTGVRLESVLADAIQRQQPDIADRLASAVRVVGDVAQAAEDQLADDDPIVLPDDRARSGESCQALEDLPDASEEVLDTFRLALRREPGSVASDVLNEVLVEADAPPPHSAGSCGARAGASNGSGVAGRQLVERGLAGGPIEDGLCDRPGPGALPLLGAGEPSLLVELVESSDREHAEAGREWHSGPRRVSPETRPDRRVDRDAQGNAFPPQGAAHGAGHPVPPVVDNHTEGYHQPVRHARDLIDRRFYRSRYDAVRTLDAFTARLRDEVEIDALRADLLGVVGDTLRPRHASVWLRDGR
jgi:hypothetical protein